MGIFYEIEGTWVGEIINAAYVENTHDQKKKPSVSSFADVSLNILIRRLAIAHSIPAPSPIKSPIF